MADKLQESDNEFRSDYELECQYGHEDDEDEYELFSNLPLNPLAGAEISHDGDIRNPS